MIIGFCQFYEQMQAWDYSVQEQLKDILPTAATEEDFAFFIKDHSSCSRRRRQLWVMLGNIWNACIMVFLFSYYA